MTISEFDTWAARYSLALTSFDRVSLLLELRHKLPIVHVPKRSVKAILEDYYSRADPSALSPVSAPDHAAGTPISDPDPSAGRPAPM